MLFGCYPNDGSELERFLQKDEHNIKAPESPQVSEECKELVENVLVDECDRYTIKEIIGSKWFKREWHPIDDNTDIKEYFENLNIQRVETEEFEYNPEKPLETTKSDDNSELKGIAHYQGQNNSTEP